MNESVNNSKLNEMVEAANKQIENAKNGLYDKPNKVKVGLYVNGTEQLIPQYKTEGASGMDVMANISEAITLKPFERRLIPTGVFVDLPDNYEFQLRPRSGLALKQGLTLLNCIGTIDDDYVNEISALIVNLSNEEQTIEPYERIAQLVLIKVEKVAWEFEDSNKNFNSKNRQGGWGSTGLK